MSTKNLNLILVAKTKSPRGTHRTCVHVGGSRRSDVHFYVHNLYMREGGFQWYGPAIIFYDA